MEKMFKHNLSFSFIEVLKLQLEFKLLEKQAVDFFMKTPKIKSDADFVQAETILYKCLELQDKASSVHFCNTLSPRLIPSIYGLSKLASMHLHLQDSFQTI